ncbi:MAG: amidohydrolase family protein, partial [Hyphomicrobiales bacterium]|nr:amidohydrolase family protein [Hyphomicrobiales bacterium]
MSLLIKGGDIVAADRTFKSDILVEGESIKAIGTGLSGTDVIDASGCFVMPGGIDPHTHLEMPFMGTTSTDHY